jgi:diguanylate cyclase (GGDEF)-like protein/PAS domain S-box-containing protein
MSLPSGSWDAGPSSPARAGQDQPTARRSVETSAGASGTTRLTPTARHPRLGTELWATVAETMVEMADEGIWFLDATDTVVYVNHRLVELLGCEADDLVGRPVDVLLDLLGADVGNGLDTLGGVGPSGELALRGRDGVTTWLQLSELPHIDEGGSYAGSIGTAIDITETRAVVELLHASELRFRALVESSMDVIAVVDAATDLLYVSPSVRTVLGYEPGEGLPLDLANVVDDEKSYAELIADLVPGPGETSPIRLVRVRHRDAGHRWLAVRVTNLLDDPAVAGLVVNFRDVTERRLAAEEELQRTREQATTVLETAHDSYIQVRMDGRITEWNRQAEETFGWSRDEAVGQGLDLIVPERSQRTLRDSTTVSAVQPPPEGRLVDNQEFAALRRDGSEVLVEFTTWVTRAPDGMRYNNFLRDITERRALERRLSHDALHDELTGLPNRNLLWNSLEGALKRAGRSDKPVAVLFCDLDQFKVINDSLGHTVGDVLLRSVAVRLAQSTRSGDIVGRFGGDEFVVVFDGVTDELEASMLGERVLRIFEQPFVVDDTELFITASIGIAVGTAATDAENLLRDADAAMYRAKEKGRARLEVFDRTLRQRAQERHDLEQALRRALERDEFRVLYQPVVSLDEGAIVGAEALVRWQRPGRGLVGPDAFIAPAEESGLILPLGSWVLETACRQLEQWRSEMPHRSLTMAVNVSGRQLASAELVDVVTRVLATTGCPPDAVTLELTETVLMSDVESSLATLADLKTLGVQIAIDDFGTGYSSLAYLKRFPIDMLKIDKSFIDNLGADPYDSAIVAAITTMGALLGQVIIAEGVETRRLARLVKEHNCALAQGFYFSEPLLPDRFLDLLRAGSRYELDRTG